MLINDFCNIFLALVVSQCLLLLKIWSKCVFGQAASRTKSCYFRKFLIGGFSFLETSFSSPLLTALRWQRLFHDHQEWFCATFFWSWSSFFIMQNAHAVNLLRYPCGCAFSTKPLVGLVWGSFLSYNHRCWKGEPTSFELHFIHE